MTERDKDGNVTVSDAEIYFRKDKGDDVEGKPATFNKMFRTRVDAD